MIKIEINNSLSKIHNLEIAQLRKLREILSYQDPNVFKYSWGSGRFKRTYLITKNGEFFTGLLSKVKTFLDTTGITYEIQDLREAPKPSKIDFSMSLPVTPYPFQENAVKAILERNRGIINAVTGSGKSIIAAMIVNALKQPTLIVTPSVELKTQLTENFRKFFDKNLVGSLGHPIAIENIDALDSDKIITYPCVIIDEFHHSGSKSYQKLNKKAWKNVYYRIGLTATPFRTKDHEKILLEAILDEIVYKFDYKQAVDVGCIVPLKAFHVSLGKEKKQYNNRSYNSTYQSLITEKSDRNSIIVDFMTKLDTDNVSTLLLVKHIQHGKLLKDLYEMKTNNKVYFANGIDRESTQYLEKFNSKQVNLLIATSIVGEGIDTKAAEVVILAGGGGKSKVQLMQNFGRVLRKFNDKQEGILISFKESSHKWFIEHHKFYLKVLDEEYGLQSEEIVVG